MFLGRIDPLGHSLDYVSAGHDSGSLLRGSGEIGAVLASSGMPLGIFPSPPFHAGPAVPLEHGDTLLLLTDGITESTSVDGTRFGATGALAFIRSRPESTAADLVHGLHHAARPFAGAVPQADDVTLAVCRVE
jgi:sigma-B regulation protein RsbU (phosphoserine phosphatase)